MGLRFDPSPGPPWVGRGWRPTGWGRILVCLCGLGLLALLLLLAMLQR